MEDIEELIAALSACSRAKGHRCSECPLLSRYDYRVCAKTVMQKAATALASFLAENERLRSNCYPRDGVEAIIRERDAYKGELAAERAKYAELQRYNVDCTKACDRQMVEILELREQNAQFSDVRNELCLKCGRYHEAHREACDGCRWKENK